MPKGIFIPADDSLELEEREFSGLEDYQAAVGGFIGVIDLVVPKFAISTLFLNEEGKLQGLPPNKRATLLLWLHQPASRLRDQVVGNAILAGALNTRGKTTDVPAQMTTLLLHTSSFVIEIVRSHLDRTKNVQRCEDFMSWVNAYVVAVDLTEFVGPIETVRVVPG